MKHTFIREKSLVRRSCRYKEVDWNVYSEEEQQAVRLPRQTRTRASPPKIKNLNDERSKRHFRWLFHNNFDAGDFMITLTFAKVTCKQQSQREFTNFVKRVRRLYKRNGAELKYLYVYEGKAKGTRPHYHIVCNSASGLSSDDIVKLWSLGYTNTKVLCPDDDGLCGSMCEYLAKEIKSGGKYERMWNGSTNLKRPDDVTDDNAISKKKMRTVQEAHRNDEVKEYIETIYTGWELIDSVVGTNEITGRPFARFRLLRKSKAKAPPKSQKSHSSGKHKTKGKVI